MIDTISLKKKILSLAVQGSLTVQSKDDTSVLRWLNDVSIKRSTCIATGKIKNYKHSETIQEAEIPFNIPATWRWVRINDIFNVRSALRIHKTDWQEEGIPFFRGRELVQLVQFGTVEPEIYISKELYEKNKEKSGVPQKNDLLVSAVGTTGKVYVVQGTKEFYYKDAYILCFENFSEINPYYAKMVLDAEYNQKSIHGNDNSAMVPQLTIQKAKSLLIPIPPADEQERIVEIVDSAFELLDTIDELQSSYLLDLNVLKSKVIDAAIRGKLTEQLPEDGSAEELYTAIQEEKAKLIKEKKIKRQKALPAITDDEIPFDIPDNWKWVRMSEILDVRDGTHDSPKYYDEGIPMITSKNLSSGILDYENVKYVSKEDAEKISERSSVDNGDILFAMIGTIGNPVIVKKEFDFVIKNVALFKPYVNTKISMEYIYWYLRREQHVFKKIVTGGLQPFISLKQFREHVMPLPPLTQQLKIVECLNSVFDSVDYI